MRNILGNNRAYRLRNNQEYRVEGVVRDDNRRIIGVWGYWEIERKKAWLSIADIAYNIEWRGHVYYVKRAGSPRSVVQVYLQTTSDGISANNLNNLPDF